MYIAPGEGQTTSRGTKFWFQQKGLITFPICCKLQRHLFEVWFYTIFFHDLIRVYSTKADGKQPPGDKVLMSTETSCHFGHLLLVLNHRRQYFLKNPLFYLFPQSWPCRKNRPRSTQDRHLNKLGSTRAPDATYQDSRSSAFWFRRKGFFFKVSTVYGREEHLGYLIWTVRTIFHSPIPWRLRMELDFDWPCGFWGEEVQRMWTTTDDGRRRTTMTDGQQSLPML